MNLYKWTVTIDGNEGALIDNVDEAFDHARKHGGIVTEYEFEYSDSYVIADHPGGRS